MPAPKTRTARPPFNSGEVAEILGISRNTIDWALSHKLIPLPKKTTPKSYAWMPSDITSLVRFLRETPHA